ncbi:MerC domain-containing protein [Spirosoma agri]|uniref:MerC domain-containing protein n=1 Tax=Spirosoma agri TaxID=1987381 RepID=A0A6M0IF06_9BACT|nr:MerC domain-containing protein [Spirosoma agri]NEU66866.1 MerC domain-containing protein [Spirosoma agri]
MKTEILSRKADYIGITGSVLCIIHCLITPILLMSTALLQDDHLRFGYLSLDYVFIGVNIVAVYFATRHYALPIVKKALWSFLGLFAIAIVLEDVNPIFEYIGYVASAGLVITHLTNIRQHRLQHAH